MSPHLVSVTRRIDSPPKALFDIVADPAMHPVIDGSGTVRTPHRGNPARLSPESTFSMGMKFGVPYRTRSRVVEFDEPHRIAWQVGGRGAIWRYTLEPAGGATLVTEQWDATDIPIRRLLLTLGFARRARRGMAETLARLAARAETSHPQNRR